LHGAIGIEVARDCEIVGNRNAGVNRFGQQGQRQGGGGAAFVGPLILEAVGDIAAVIGLPVGVPEFEKPGDFRERTRHRFSHGLIEFKDLAGSLCAGGSGDGGGEPIAETDGATGRVGFDQQGMQHDLLQREGVTRGAAVSRKAF